jgi:DNA-binding transcriptional MerR regulator
MELAGQHLEIVHAEQARAEAAAARLERWAESDPGDSGPPYDRIGDAARKLGATIDQLRNWERNALIEVPRDPRNGYRLYSRQELGRLSVIRLLIQTGFSVMAVLRMVTALDAGETRDLRAVLDTPRPDEDAFSAADRWLSALADQEERAHQMLAILEEMKTLHWYTRVVK